MLKLKSILASVMVFVCCTGFVSAEAYYEINAEGGVIYHEDPAECEEFDVDTSYLDNYIKSLGDPERIDLMMKIFHLPTKVVHGVEEMTPPKSEEEVLKTAQEYAQKPIEELRVEAREMEENFRKMGEECARKSKIYEEQQRKELEKAIKKSLEHSLDNINTLSRNKYSYTLHGAMSNNNTRSEDVWITSRVEWGVSGNEVIGITPHTTTGKNSYYTWNGGIDGDQYLSGGRGYVNKSGAFFITDSEDDAWEVFVSGVFNHTSTPVSKDEGYRQY